MSAASSAEISEPHVLMICAVFVHPLALLLGNMFRNTLQTWSDPLSAMLCSARKSANNVSAGIVSFSNALLNLLKRLPLCSSNCPRAFPLKYVALILHVSTHPRTHGGISRSHKPYIDPIWNNASRECLFMVFYLTLRFCYGVTQSSVLGHLVFTMYTRPLGITCMLMTHSCIYHWILTMR